MNYDYRICHIGLDKTKLYNVLILSQENYIVHYWLNMIQFEAIKH